MTPLKETLMYEYHESFLLNLFLSKEKFVFRFAVPGFMACDRHPEIKEGEYLIVDVVCNSCIIDEIYMPHGDFRFVNVEVLDFYIEDNKCILYIEDGQKFYLSFTCSNLSENDLYIIKGDEISDCRPVDPLVTDKLHTLPI